LILTTDHGTINVKNPSKVVGDKTRVWTSVTKPVAALPTSTKMFMP
jgi:hypothetical protein